MFEIVTRGVWCRRAALVGVLFLPFVTGCAGVHLHNPDDEKIAKEAQTAFKDAGLSKALENERLLVAEQNQRHRAALRDHAEAMRDVYLTSIVGSNEGDAFKGLSEAVETRIKELTNGSTKVLSELEEDMSREKKRLEKAKKNYEIMEGIIGKGSKESVQRLTCPLPDEVKCANTPMCDPITFDVYKKQCTNYLTAKENFEKASANPDTIKIGELEKVRQELAALNKAKADAEKQVEAAKNKYEKAKTTYQKELKQPCSSTPQSQTVSSADEKKSAGSSVGTKEGEKSNTEKCIADAAVDLATKLNELGKSSAQAGEVLHNQEARGMIQKVSDQLFSLNCVISAFGVDGSTENNKTEGAVATKATKKDENATCPQPGTPEYGTALKIASTLAMVNKAISNTKRPVVSALLLEAELLRLTQDRLQGRLDEDEKRIAIMETRHKFLSQELEHLLEAQNSISLYKTGYRKIGMKEKEVLVPCDLKLSIKNAVRSNKDDKCAEIAAQGLNSYTAAWDNGRIPAKEAEASLIGLRHEAVVNSSENAFALWDQALGIPIAQVLAYHESGIRSEDLANLIHALGLGAIAVQVK